jgi:hypothetical protein
MRFTLIFFLFFSFSVFSQTIFDVSNDFFQTYVKNGKVDYSSIKTSDITELTELYSSTDISGWSKSEKKAFYINAYNFYVIKLITEDYPVNSPMDVIGFFDRKKINVAGSNITLNELENEILRKEFSDARLHFVLVCGAVGCPVIIPEAYFPLKLDNLLDRQAILAINDKNFIRVNPNEKSIEISEIFKWYKEDFEAEFSSILNFINKYRTEKLSENYLISYYSYDWSLNDVKDNNASQTKSIQTFTAGSLLKKKQFELVSFNSIYSETKTNWMNQTFSGFRTTFSSSLLQFTYGVSKSARFNLGVDLNFKASSSNSSENFNNITEPFAFKNNDSTRFGLAYIAPRVRLMPFKKLPNFTIQSSYFVILPKSPEGDFNLYWIEWNRHIWWNQFFYTKMMANNKLQLFTEVDLLFRLAKGSNQHSILELPASCFLSYFPNKKVTLYIMSQHTQRFVAYSKNGANSDWPINANFTNSGVGFKYQLTDGLNIELFYTNFWNAKNAGFGETFNLGFRWVH